ncbi:MAG: hypothetical protein FJX04_09845 [Alphaproteobacteria bacterium]|nr:hypothetical protein [Alphaproteobacteria bacterium]
MYLSFISSKKIPNIFLLLIIIILFCAPDKADAMNWEGHDDWMTEQQHAKKLLNSVPHAKPLTSAFPSCQEREEKHARNPYEQRPIAGVNCLNENDTRKSVTE